MNNKQKTERKTQKDGNAESEGAVSLRHGLGAFSIKEQTQEELTQRTLYYETEDGNFFPDPNEQEHFRNRGICWIPRRHNTKRNSEE